MSNFWQRAITGTVFVLVLVSAIILGGWYMQILFGIIAGVGLYEFYSLFDKSETKPQKILGTLIGAGLYFDLIFTRNLAFGAHKLFILITVGIVLLSFIIISINELFRKSQKPFESIALTIVGIFYLVFPFWLLTFLFGPDDNVNNVYDFWPILSLFILIWCNDTFAYLTGRLLGKHKLFERISPKKTWEGFIGGIVFAIIAGVLMAYLLEWSYAKMITYGVVVGVIGTTGDLVESMLKRSVNVKDSGNILPGHGGILDRFDAVLFVVPVVFFLENFVFNQFV